MISIETPIKLNIKNSSISYALGQTLSHCFDHHDEGQKTTHSLIQLIYYTDQDIDNPDVADIYVSTVQVLEKMIAMGLGSLPVKSILIPQMCLEEQDPLLYFYGAGSAEEVSVFEEPQIFDISGNMSKYFPGHFTVALYELQSILKRAGTAGYVIGGITRDLLMTREKRFELQDVDITIEGNITEFVTLLEESSKNFEVESVFTEFGTAKVKYKDSLCFDIASTRKEVYASCGALPDVVNTGVPLTQDILRRDFTINALALSINDLGQVLDYTGGLEDISEEYIRILHPASFYEDPSRILRALKFVARFGLSLSPDTDYLLGQFLEHGHQCYKGGGERIKQELKGLLTVQESATKHDTITKFMNVGGLRLINMHLDIEELDKKALDRFYNAILGLPLIMEKVDDYTRSDKKNFLFRFYLCFILGSLEENLYEETAHRLGLTKAEREAIETFKQFRQSRVLNDINEYTSSAELVEIFKGKTVSALAAAMADISLENPEKLEILLNALTVFKKRWEHISLELNGHDLIDLGVPEGKVLGEVMQQLLRAKLSGMIHERMDEIRFVKEKILPKLKTDKATEPG